MHKDTGTSSDQSPRPLWSRPRTVMVAIVVLVGIHLGTSFWIRMNRNVFLVNGLPTTYSVKINGGEYEIGPFEACEITLSEGRLEISCLNEDLGIPNQQVELQTNILARPFVRPTFVLNPDRAAIVVEETIHCTTDVHSPPQATTRYFTGDLLYTVCGIDQPFVEPSQSITTEVSKHLFVLPNPKERSLFMIMGISRSIGRDRAIAVAKRYIRATPDAMLLLNYMAKTLEPDDMLDLLKEGLDKKPVRVEWHRTYQHVKTRTSPHYDIEAEYRERVRKSNNDPAMIYLLGRVSADAETQRSRFKQAANARRPCVHALNALAYDALEDGRFEEALAYSVRARKTMPENIGFDVVYVQSLLANGKYRQAETFVNAKARDNSLLAETWQPRFLEICAMQKDAGKARRFIASLKSLWQKKLGSEYARQREDTLATEICYLFGDYTTYITRQVKSKSPAARFQAAITNADAKTAAAELAKISSPEIEQCLELHLLEQVTDNGSATPATHKLLLSRLNESDFRYQRLAAILTQEEPVSIADVDNISLGIDLRPTVLAILGMSQPQSRTQFFNAARKLNIFPSYPYQLVDRALRQAGATQAGGGL